MALEAGVLTLTVEFAQGLKDKDFFGKMDPYVIVQIGSQTYRTKTIQSGGTNPVFNESFRFNIINDNTFQLTIKDEDVTSDEVVGTCRGDLAKARASLHDRQQVPAVSRSGKQHGFVSVDLKFEPNRAAGSSHQQQPQQQQQYQQQQYQQQAPPQQYAYPPQQAPVATVYYSAPPPAVYGAPPPAAYPYGAPAPAPYPYPAAAAPPQGYAYPPQPGYPPQAYPPQPGYAPPPAPYGAYPGYPPR